MAVRFRNGKKELKAYNVKQINKIIEIKENTFENINRNPYADEYCEEPVKILVHNTRGAIMRFMTEFSTYKKESIFDDETGDCTTTFYYHSEEKPEIYSFAYSKNLTKQSGHNSSSNLDTISNGVLNNSQSSIIVSQSICFLSHEKSIILP